MVVRLELMKLTPVPFIFDTNGISRMRLLSYDEADIPFRSLVPAAGEVRENRIRDTSASRQVFCRSTHWRPTAFPSPAQRARHAGLTSSRPVHPSNGSLCRWRICRVHLLLLS